MIKHFTLALCLVLTGVCAVQQFSLHDLDRDLDQARDDIASLRVDLARSGAALQVLHAISRENRRQIDDIKRKRTLTVTAYSPRTQETDATPFTTATNNRVRPGIVAVSRDLFNQGWVFGKRVYIKNYGVFVIDDLMASHKKNQVDIFMMETDAALEFGKKKLEVHLLDA
ncbi:MAG: 3D domain-containing protein [Desulfovibrionaceae bacterium]